MPGGFNDCGPSGGVSGTGWLITANFRVRVKWHDIAKRIRHREDFFFAKVTITPFALVVPQGSKIGHDLSELPDLILQIVHDVWKLCLHSHSTSRLPHRMDAFLDVLVFSLTRCCFNRACFSPCSLRNSSNISTCKLKSMGGQINEYG